MICNFCENKGCHIADGLYMCQKCEKIGAILVQEIETRKIRWKRLDMVIVDEIIIK